MHRTRSPGTPPEGPDPHVIDVENLAGGATARTVPVPACLTAGLRRRGLVVIVVARPGSLSRDRRRLAPYRPRRDAAPALAA